MLSVKVLLENAALRGRKDVTRDDIQAWRLAGDAGRDAGDPIRPARVADAGFTGVRRGRTRRDARGDAALGGHWEDQPARPGPPGHRPQRDGREANAKALDPERRVEYSRNRTLRVSEMGRLGIPQLRGGAAGHRHLPPGQSRAYRPLGVELARPVGRGGRLSRYSGRDRQPYDDGQRPRRIGLGRRRDRGGSGDARPAGLDADPRGGRLPPVRKPARGDHRS